MNWNTIVVGSEALLLSAMKDSTPGSLEGTDVVLIPTAAAFTGATEAAVRVSSQLEPLGARIEALMVTDRAGASEEYFATRILAAHVVVLLDGSSLHARSVWRDSSVGVALARASRIVAVGHVATVLGEEMIDPRGGAPTTGLGIRRGAVICSRESQVEFERTRALLDSSRLLIVVAEDGIVAELNGNWFTLSPGGVTASLGDEEISLPETSSSR